MVLLPALTYKQYTMEHVILRLPAWEGLSLSRDNLTNMNKEHHNHDNYRFKVENE